MIVNQSSIFTTKDPCSLRVSGEVRIFAVQLLILFRSHFSPPICVTLRNYFMLYASVPPSEE